MAKHEGITERATELGRLLGQTDEFQALHRARQRVNEDREVSTMLRELAEMESKVADALQRGEQPEADVAESFERTFGKLQGNPVYQSLVAAQSNFDKLLQRVNEEIGRGMEAGSQSRIILPS